MHLRAVEGSYRRRRQAAALQSPGTLYGVQHMAVLAIGSEIGGQIAARIAAGGLQSSGGYSEAILAVLMLYSHIRQQAADALHHKGRSKGRAVQRHGGIADMEQLRGLGQSRIDILQLVIQLIK